MGVLCVMWMRSALLVCSHGDTLFKCFNIFFSLFLFTTHGVDCVDEPTFSLSMYSPYILPVQFHNIRARSAAIEDKEKKYIDTESRNLIKSARSEDRDGYKRRSDCCVFLFLDGSAHYFDSFLREKTGTYTLQPGTINDYPHYANKECSLRGRYTADCTYIWKTNGAWIIGDGTSVGE